MDVLEAHTGDGTIPQIFINGQYLGFHAWLAMCDVGRFFFEEQ
jgi:hypothetical protein